MDYYFYRNGYNRLSELSFYIDLGKVPEDIVSTWTASRRRGYKYSLKNNLTFKKLETKEEIEDFYRVLCKNLSKFHTAPVHTYEELLELKYDRLPEDIDFYGTFYEEKCVAGSMVFYFGQKVFHTQYLAQDMDYSNLYLMNFTNYWLIKTAKEMEFSTFSFGISTENRGKVLNTTLALFKEGFGCDFCVNQTYEKNLG